MNTVQTMGIQERRQREKEELRDRILEAASDLFIEEGFQNVSIRKIADKIEYAPSTIYLYFKDKTELLGSICGEVFTQLSALLDKLTLSQLCSEERLRKAVRTYIEFGMAHPQHYILTFCLPPPKEVLDHGGGEDPGLRTFDKLRECLRGGIEDGTFRKADLEVLSQTTWMMMHGVTSLMINKKYLVKFPWADDEALIAMAVDNVVRAIKAG
jgi:AcrR family transcriptional regulator